MAEEKHEHHEEHHEEHKGEGAKGKTSQALAQTGQFAKDHWKAIGVIIAGITLIFVYLQWRNSQTGTTGSITGTNPGGVIDTSQGGNPADTGGTGAGGGGGTTKTVGGTVFGGSGGGSGGGNTVGGGTPPIFQKQQNAVIAAVNQTAAKFVGNQVQQEALLFHAQQQVIGGVQTAQRNMQLASVFGHIQGASAGGAAKRLQFSPVLTHFHIQ